MQDSIVLNTTKLFRKEFNILIDDDVDYTLSEFKKVISGIYNSIHNKKITIYADTLGSVNKDRVIEHQKHEKHEKKALSSYNVYVQKMMPMLCEKNRKANIKINPRELMKVIGANWTALSQKQKDSYKLIREE